MKLPQTRLKNMSENVSDESSDLLVVFSKHSFQFQFVFSGNAEAVSMIEY